MWTSIRQKASEKWDLMRIIKLFVAFYLLYQSYLHADFLPAFLAIILLYQSIWNVGCCGTNCSGDSCDISNKN